MPLTVLAAMTFLLTEHVTAADRPIFITLITKDPDNHFWTAMVEGAQEAAKGQNVQITVAAAIKATRTARSRRLNLRFRVAMTLS